MRLEQRIDGQTDSVFVMTGGLDALCISLVSLDDAVINITGQRNRPRIVSLSAHGGVSGGWEVGGKG